MTHEPAGNQRYLAPAPWLLLVAVAAVPSLDAVARLGRLHPDEVFQALEPALRHAFGFGLVADEWRVGLRNWLVPGVFSLLLQATHFFGADDPWVRRAVLELPQFALNLAMVNAAFRFAQRRIGAASARWAVLLLLAWGPWVWFAGRSMSESISTALLVWALERLDDDALTSRSAFGAGVLLGFAQITRYGSAAIILPTLVFLAARRRFSILRATMLGGLLMAFALGLLDRLTWGHWFHSLFEYLRFNIFTGGASSFGLAPPSWYLTHLFVAPLGVIALGLIEWRFHPILRSWLFVTAALVYFVAISATDHKEIRFLYPALVVSLVSVAPAVVHFVSSTRTWWRWGLGCLALALTGALYFMKTPYDVERSDLFRATVLAGRGDATGLVLINEGTWGSGGSFYLGKEMPWCTCDTPTHPCFVKAISDRAFNRALLMLETDNAPSFVTELTKAGFQQTKRIGLVSLFERRSK